LGKRRRTYARAKATMREALPVAGLIDRNAPASSAAPDTVVAPAEVRHHSDALAARKQMTMTLGPTLVMECTSCCGLIKCATIRSGNNIGARHWTDGKVYAPELPDFPALVKCPHCETLLWIDELEEIGEFEPWNEGDEFSGSRARVTPSADDYFALLEAEILEPDKEMYVRLRAWWAGNDRRRPGLFKRRRGRRNKRKRRPLSDGEIANLRELADLLDESDDRQRVLKAEAMRELGLFDEAVSLLDHPFEGDWRIMAETIEGLAAKEDAFVADVPTQLRGWKPWLFR